MTDENPAAEAAPGAGACARASHEEAGKQAYPGQEGPKHADRRARIRARRVRALNTLEHLMDHSSSEHVRVAAAKAALRYKPEKENLMEESRIEGGLYDDTDVDTAIAYAKWLLDELAARKSSCVCQKDALDEDGARGAGHPEG